MVVTGGIAMEKYENLGLVGEGSYGMVLKCRHKETGQIVAIKKFLESEDDKMVKKIAMREVRMLKQLRHENLVNLIEVFRRKKRLYLVFEFVDHTVLDDLERCPNGLDEDMCRKVLWQVLKGIEFCHLHNIIHRDIKPENILVSKSSIVKLCDFGFARMLAQPGEAYTDYVATRWYRAPELLVGDTKYGRAVDIWALGCLLAEMLTGEPLFPGDSDIDQLYHIVKCFGNLPQRHREIFHKNPLFVGMRLPEVRETEPLEKKFPKLSTQAIDIMKQSLQLEASHRPTCSQLLKHEFFQKGGFAQRFVQELKDRIQKEYKDNPLLRGKDSKSTDKKDSDSENKGSGGKKKKKDRKESRDSKDSSEDKPRRKLPEPEKVTKKSTPPATMTSTGGLPPPVPLAKTNTPTPHSLESETIEAHSHSHSQSSHHSHTGIPPINQSTASSPSMAMSPSYATVNNVTLSSPNVYVSSNPHQGPPPLRMSDKSKKSQPKLFQQKASPPNHHSIAISPQPLQGEKTSLHEKTMQYDKMTNVKKGRLKDEGRSDRLSLPEVKGAEGLSPKTSTGKSKRSYMATIPHITNIDPFPSQPTNSQSGHSPTSEKDSSNLPLV